ncbi:hypothetical protein PR202_ga01605 [Eleusine coracana subsp. coracana]|uniref:Uncharacterized protein n=1 Tax=Eleusine coracana subsp. coracana TaxID=191504 RepID=A0AAV5BH13_ELECO|nr:hypothetical protein PR202_ga00918 [Eleusine coracana subsp. coracana]GJM85805.1 hypothetical protein PR202_ga01605 [Eleusine coracana subsp. coracana]
MGRGANHQLKPRRFSAVAAAVSVSPPGTERQRSSASRLHGYALYVSKFGEEEVAEDDDFDGKPTAVMVQPMRRREPRVDAAIDRCNGSYLPRLKDFQSLGCHKQVVLANLTHDCLQMSLHIGQLSPDARQPYLERLFQRYGPCFVYLKDGYGFAVYECNADAARALRALHGKYVCDRRITVNWSKNQPRFSQGFRRNSRFAESPHRRTSRDGRENIRFRDSLAVKNRPPSHDEHHNKNPPASHEKNSPASHDESHDSASAREKEYDKLTEGVNDAGENIAEEEASLEEMKRDEGGTVDASAIEHERWAEAGKGTPGDGDGFDCYEPYHGLDRQKETEDMIKASPWDSRGHGRSSEKWRDHSDKHVDVSHNDKSRSPPTCYTCGVSGHCARYCPQEMDAKLKARRDGLHFRDKLELRQRRFGSPSWRQPDFVFIQWIKSVIEFKMAGNHFLILKREYLDSRHRSPSYSAHSSSKSSQPTQREGSRSNINKPVPFSTSGPPQHKSSPDVGNKNPDGLVNCPLEDKSDFWTTPENEIKHTNNKQEGKGSALNSEVLPDKCANVDGYTGVKFGKSLADYNDNITSEVRSQNANFDGTSSVKSNQDILGKNGRSKSLKLTTNEVVSALKRYRMETHEVESLDQPVEKYFGAARLWPWEIIYYRRLKKGPISTENYARRLEQNKEFGIVDQLSNGQLRGPEIGNRLRLLLDIASPWARLCFLVYWFDRLFHSFGWTIGPYQSTIVDPSPARLRRASGEVRSRHCGEVISNRFTARNCGKKMIRLVLRLGPVPFIGESVQRSRAFRPARDPANTSHPSALSPPPPSSTRSAPTAVGRSPLSRGSLSPVIGRDNGNAVIALMLVSFVRLAADQDAEEHLESVLEERGSCSAERKSCICTVYLLESIPQRTGNEYHNPKATDLNLILSSSRSFFGVEDFVDEDNSRPYTYKKEKRSKNPHKHISFKQRTIAYMEPFTLDVFISKRFVSASLTHRSTCRQVAVAGTNSKDVKAVLQSRSDIPACLAVGRFLAERAKEVDVYTCTYMPRERDKFEGKIRAVVQSLIDNGINVKLYLD